MKKHFYTGLIVILPLLITFYIFDWLLTKILTLISGTVITKSIKNILNLFYGVNHGNEFLFQALVYMISIIIMLLLVTLLGYTMKIVLFSKLVKKMMSLVERIPVIKTVYTTTKQIIDVLYNSEGDSAYKKVVLIEYPRKGMYAIGFLTAEKNEIVREILGEKEIANVFVPTSPNPTSGMLVCVPKDEVHNLDISVETAFKLIISGGYVTEETVKKISQKKRWNNDEKSDSINFFNFYSLFKLK